MKEMMSATQFRTVDSPFGPLTLAGRDGRLMHLRMVDQTDQPSHDGWESDDTAFPVAVDQLEAYFAGELSSSTSTRPGRHAVPAQRLGGAADDPVRRDPVVRRDRGPDRQPAASRAVGLANGHNPVGIIVPCHRVIGSNGSLTGYGGGLERKRALLALERTRNPVTPTLFD